MKDSEEIAEEVYDYLYEDDSQIFKNMLTEEELDVIEQVYYLDHGLHLIDKEYEGETQEEEDENFSEAYKQWCLENKWIKKKGKPYKFTPKQQRDIELRQINPYYKKITD